MHDSEQKAIKVDGNICAWTVSRTSARAAGDRRDQTSPAIVPQLTAPSPPQRGRVPCRHAQPGLCTRWVVPIGAGIESNSGFYIEVEQAVAVASERKQLRAPGHLLLTANARRCPQCRESNSLPLSVSMRTIVALAPRGPGIGKRCAGRRG